MPRDLKGDVLLEVLALGAAFNATHDEDRGLVIRWTSEGRVVTAWAIYPCITRYDIWTMAPDAARALELLRHALRET